MLDLIRRKLHPTSAIRRGALVQQKKRFRVATTDSRHALPVAENLLGQDFAVERPDEAWTADITYVATDEGWLYVAAIKDLFAG